MLDNIINDGHIVGLDVDKCVSLLFIATNGVTPFANYCSTIVS